MISVAKLLVGAGALGTSGLVAWGAYHISLPKTIQDKLSREGLKILNLNKESDVDKEAWKKKIETHKSDSGTIEGQVSLKINDLDLSNTTEKEAEDIKKFKKKCSQLLLTSLGDEGVDLKEKQVRKWCVKEVPQTAGN